MIALRRAAAASDETVLLVLPGGGCDPGRYDWLFALTDSGTSVAVLADPTVQRVAQALEQLAGEGAAVHVVGHSAGAAAILDALEPAANPLLDLPHGFALASLPASVTSLGCSLQARVLDWNQAHRHETRPLYCPAAVRLTFVAGAQDAIADPVVVARTAARYGAAHAFLMDDATHYGWAGQRDVGDREEFDADPSLDTHAQRARTLLLLADVVGGRAVRAMPGVVPLRSATCTA